jgi:hypothetical protein
LPRLFAKRLLAERHLANIMFGLHFTDVRPTHILKGLCHFSVLAKMSVGQMSVGQMVLDEKARNQPENIECLDEEGELFGRETFKKCNKTFLKHNLLEVVIS